MPTQCHASWHGGHACHPSRPRYPEHWQPARSVCRVSHRRTPSGVAGASDITATAGAGGVTTTAGAGGVTTSGSAGAAGGVPGRRRGGQGPCRPRTGTHRRRNAVGCQEATPRPHRRCGARARAWHAVVPRQRRFLQVTWQCQCQCQCQWRRHPRPGPWPWGTGCTTHLACCWVACRCACGRQLPGLA